MNKIISVNEAIKTSNKLRLERKTIVLVGGFFDILHIGHIRFLEKSKKLGDVLFVLLESDEKAKQIKGKNRPINSQEDRAKILASLQSVDYVINLPKMIKNEQYDKMVNQIKPAIIATTYGDQNIAHKKRQAKQINAKVVEVIERIQDQSTTRLIRQLAE